MIFGHLQLIALFIFTAIVNIISTTHLYPIMLIGISYYIFSLLIHQKDYYKLIWSCLSFFVFEINFGFPIFSIMLLSYFIHLIIVPYLSTNLSFSKANYVISIFIFYIVFSTFISINDIFSFELLIQILINYIIDIFILVVIL